MVGEGCAHLHQYFCVFGRVGQVVQFTRVFLEVEQHFGGMGVEGLRPVGVGVVSSQDQFVPCLIGRHSPLVVIAQGELTVRDVAADVFKTSVGRGAYRHEVVQLVGR